MKRQIINLHPSHLNQLVKEFKKSRQTIYNAIWYTTNSDLAMAIRKRAKELLQKEAENVAIKLEK